MCLRINKKKQQLAQNISHSNQFRPIHAMIYPARSQEKSSQIDALIQGLVVILLQIQILVLKPYVEIKVQCTFVLPSQRACFS